MDPAGSWRPRIMALATLGVVAACAAGGWRLLDQQATIARAQVIAAERPVVVAPGRDYYVHVKLIELHPRRADGGKWEPRSKYAPDIQFALYWNGTQIFESPKRPSRLIAEWDLLRLDLKDALLSGHVEIASAINAPMVHAAAGGMLTIDVWDVDVALSDEVGRFDLPIGELHEGLNTLTPADSGVARVLLDMVPRDMPLPDLLERASNR